MFRGKTHRCSKCKNVQSIKLPYCTNCGRALFSRENPYDPKKHNIICPQCHKSIIQDDPSKTWYCYVCNYEFQPQAPKTPHAYQLQNARRAELAGHFEDAAKIYEQLYMYQKAGELRQKLRESKITVVGVDANRLVTQLVNKGLILTYHCSFCGSPLKIGKGAREMIQTCPHCKSSVNIVDLEKLIKTLL
jgi:ribosomal protein L37AE/L43A